MNKKFQYKRIEVSLQYGKVFHKGWFVTLYVFIGLCAIAGIMTDVGMFFEFLAGLEDYYDMIAFMYSSFVFVFCILVAIVPLVIKTKLKRKIYLWLDDAVELNAKTSTIATETTRAFLTVTKLKVEFKYNRKHYICTSEKPNNHGDSYNYWFTNRGFSRALTKYADKNVKILYSPKYNQVLILKRK